LRSCRIVSPLGRTILFAVRAGVTSSSQLT
jgi:hypothetical protein